MQIYLQDITNPTTSDLSCTLDTSVAPGGLFTISMTDSSCGSLSESVPTFGLGDTVSIKIVTEDGGSATSSTKVIGGGNDQTIELSSATLYGGVTALGNGRSNLKPNTLD